MSLLKLVIAIVGLAAISGCNYSASSSSGSGGTSATSSTSSSSTRASQEVMLSGDSGVAELAGDKVELKDGTVFVNGVSFGPVPAGAKVKYTKGSDGGALFVDNERRGAQQ